MQADGRRFDSCRVHHFMNIKNISERIEPFVGKIDFIDYGEDDFSDHMGILKGKWYLIGVKFDGEDSGGVLLSLDREAFDKLLNSAELCRMSQLYKKRMEFDPIKKAYKILQ